MNKFTTKIGDHINIKLHKWDRTAIIEGINPSLTLQLILIVKLYIFNLMIKMH